MKSEVDSLISEENIYYCGHKTQDTEFSHMVSTKCL